MDTPNQPDPKPEGEQAETVDDELSDAEQQEPQIEIDPHRLQMLMQSFREQQNLPMGAAAGAVAATIGAVLWAVITVATEWQIGWMAVGVAFLVGIAIRSFGKGVDMPFQILGAVLALGGSLVGNYLSVCAFAADYMGMDYMTVIMETPPGDVVELMVENFHPMDLLFYGLAVYYGYKYSVRRLTEEDIETVKVGSTRPMPSSGPPNPMIS